MFLQVAHEEGRNEKMMHKTVYASGFNEVGKFNRTWYCINVDYLDADLKYGEECIFCTKEKGQRPKPIFGSYTLCDKHWHREAEVKTQVESTILGY
jgi:hypothetical protein